MGFGKKPEDFLGTFKSSFSTPVCPGKLNKKQLQIWFVVYPQNPSITHTIHLWYIYLHVFDILW